MTAQMTYRQLQQKVKELKTTIGVKSVNVFTSLNQKREVLENLYSIGMAELAEYESHCVPAIKTENGDEPTEPTKEMTKLEKALFRCKREIEGTHNSPKEKDVWRQHEFMLLLKGRYCTPQELV